MVKVSLAIFALVSFALSTLLLYFNHLLFAVVFLISDLVVFLTIKTMAKSAKEPKIDPVAFSFAFVGALIVSHFSFRGYYDWEEFQPWGAVRNIQLNGGGEVLLSFSVCVLLVAVIYRKIGLNR